jgi:formate dehydrogenase major subunit
VGISLTKGKVRKTAARWLRASVTKRSQKQRHAEGIREYYRFVNNLSFLALQWPVVRQIANKDGCALGDSALSERSRELAPRTRGADAVVKSICPYCAVGCGQLVYVKNTRIIDIEGDPESPISRGCLCPKGAATFQLVTGTHRLHEVLYRRPHAREWETIPLERAMEMVAERVKKTRDETWEEHRRTMGIAHLGGATLDNEENYLLKKLYTALGIVQVENQARI